MGSDNLFHKRKTRDNAALQRQKRERERNKRFLIVCEGTKTEPTYFQELLEDLGIPSTTVRIARNNGTSPDRIVSHALGLYDDDAKCGDAYDKVFCVFDRDAHTTFDTAVKYIEGLAKEGKPFIAITSNPCFEFWLILHFSYTTAPFQATGKKSVGDKVVEKLKKQAGFEDYGKGQRGIYQSLKEKLPTAIKNAKKLREHSKTTGSVSPLTNVDELVIEIQNLKKSP